MACSSTMEPARQLAGGGYRSSESGLSKKSYSIEPSSSKPDHSSHFLEMSHKIVVHQQRTCKASNPRNTHAPFGIFPTSALQDGHGDSHEERWGTTRVLVVEDDVELNRTACSYLTARGYDCAAGGALFGMGSNMLSGHRSRAHGGLVLGCAVKSVRFRRSARRLPSWAFAICAETYTFFGRGSAIGVLPSSKDFRYGPCSSLPA